MDLKVNDGNFNYLIKSGSFGVLYRVKNTLRMECSHMKENTTLRMDMIVGYCPHMEMSNLQIWKLHIVN